MGPLFKAGWQVRPADVGVPHAEGTCWTFARLVLGVARADHPRDLDDSAGRIAFFSAWSNFPRSAWRSSSRRRSSAARVLALTNFFAVARRFFFGMAEL